MTDVARLSISFVTGFPFSCSTLHPQPNLSTNENIWTNVNITSVGFQVGSFSLKSNFLWTKVTQVSSLFRMSHSVSNFRSYCQNFNKRKRLRHTNEFCRLARLQIIIKHNLKLKIKISATPVPKKRRYLVHFS